MVNRTPTGSSHRKKGRFGHFLRTVLFASLIVTSGLSLLRLFGLLESWELAAYDTFIQWKPTEPVDDRILVVGISESDIQSREEYPIRESTVVQLLETLERNAPRVIALDFGLDFPRGTPAERAALTKTLASNDHIVSACLMSSERFIGVPPAPGTPDDLVGFADFPQDKGGVVRRSLLVSTPAEVTHGEVIRSHLCNQPNAEALLSLSLLSAVIYLEGEDIFAEQSDSGDLSWGTVRIPRLGQRSGGYAQTEAPDYQTLLNYRSPNDAVHQVSLTDVLSDRVDPDWIRDRVVMIGYTSPVANDLHTTPYPETTNGLREMPGVLVHAQATSQLLSAVLDGRPLLHTWPKLVEVLLFLGWSGVAGLAAYFIRRWWLLLLGTLGLTGLLWGVAYLIFLQGLWLPVVPMTIAGLVTALIAGLAAQARNNIYAQAIFEQLKAEFTGQPTQGETLSQRDRIEELVRRAKSIRQREAIGDVLDGGEMQRLTSDPLNMEFDSPEVQRFYEQIKTQLQQQFEAEKASLARQSSRLPGSGKSARLQALLQKSQQARTGLAPSPNARRGHE